MEAEAEVFLFSCLAPAAAVVLMERRKEVMEECLVKSESKYLKLLRNPWKIFRGRLGPVGQILTFAPPERHLEFIGK